MLPTLRTIQRTRFTIARPAFRQPTITTVRTFTSAQQLRLKEDGDRSPEQLDKIKHDQIDKQKKGEGHWHEELGSQSESHVKADREEVHDHDEPVSYTHLTLPTNREV